uniref:Uncharacterized protein n=1 Tax=Chromera velia CCMP2878 TaxID=1169474 RepID=A0A0G4FND8_9ALVE|eukprot:Cvel_17945.t1-p1 / transcript=Cvel_17945.t1 / gene=Cvel_17945 / organism=Chromera_velia_CCMP2878 / gene_product=hypothetical protein / transcript_product=hypothetical protein / location=Cvel_scaffold1459:3105-11535(+) / protein_length=1493 / sequence_SO=supercontig / SO=protein_coding / is_pseudo=false
MNALAMDQEEVPASFVQKGTTTTAAPTTAFAGTIVTTTTLPAHTTTKAAEKFSEEGTDMASDKQRAAAIRVNHNPVEVDPYYNATATKEETTTTTTTTVFDETETTTTPEPTEAPKSPLEINEEIMAGGGASPMSFLQTGQQVQAQVQRESSHSAPSAFAQTEQASKDTGKAKKRGGADTEGSKSEATHRSSSRSHRSRQQRNRKRRGAVSREPQSGDACENRVQNEHEFLAFRVQKTDFKNGREAENSIDFTANSIEDAIASAEANAQFPPVSTTPSFFHQEFTILAFLNPDKDQDPASAPKFATIFEMAGHPALPGDNTLLGGPRDSPTPSEERDEEQWHKKGLIMLVRSKTHIRLVLTEADGSGAAAVALPAINPEDLLAAHEGDREEHDEEELEEARDRAALSPAFFAVTLHSGKACVYYLTGEENAITGCQDSVPTACVNTDITPLSIAPSAEHLQVSLGRQTPVHDEYVEALHHEIEQSLDHAIVLDKDHEETPWRSFRKLLFGTGAAEPVELQGFEGQVSNLEFYSKALPHCQVIEKFQKLKETVSFDEDCADEMPEDAGDETVGDEGHEEHEAASFLQTSSEEPTKKPEEGEQETPVCSEPCNGDACPSPVLVPDQEFTEHSPACRLYTNLEEDFISFWAFVDPKESKAGTVLDMTGMGDRLAVSYNIEESDDGTGYVAARAVLGTTDIEADYVPLPSDEAPFMFLALTVKPGKACLYAVTADGFEPSDCGKDSLVELRPSCMDVEPEGGMHQFIAKVGTTPMLGDPSRKSGGPVEIRDAMLWGQGSGSQTEVTKHFRDNAEKLGFHVECDSHPEPKETSTSFMQESTRKGKAGKTGGTASEGSPKEFEITVDAIGTKPKKQSFTKLTATPGDVSPGSPAEGLIQVKGIRATERPNLERPIDVVPEGVLAEGEIIKVDPRNALFDAETGSLQFQDPRIKSGTVYDVRVELLKVDPEAPPAPAEATPMKENMASFVGHTVQTEGTLSLSLPEGASPTGKDIELIWSDAEDPDNFHTKIIKYSSSTAKFNAGSRKLQLFDESFSSGPVYSAQVPIFGKEYVEVGRMTATKKTEVKDPSQGLKQPDVIDEANRIAYYKMLEMDGKTYTAPPLSARLSSAEEASFHAYVKQPVGPVSNAKPIFSLGDSEHGSVLLRRTANAGKLTTELIVTPAGGTATPAAHIKHEFCFDDGKEDEVAAAYAYVVATVGDGQACLYDEMEKAVKLCPSATESSFVQLASAAVTGAKGKKRGGSHAQKQHTAAQKKAASAASVSSSRQAAEGSRAAPAAVSRELSSQAASAAVKKDAFLEIRGSQLMHAMASNGNDTTTPSPSAETDTTTQSAIEPETTPTEAPADPPMPSAVAEGSDGSFLDTSAEGSAEKQEDSELLEELEHEESRAARSLAASRSCFPCDTELKPQCTDLPESFNLKALLKASPVMIGKGSGENFFEGSLAHAYVRGRVEEPAFVTEVFHKYRGDDTVNSFTSCCES